MINGKLGRPIDKLRNSAKMGRIATSGDDSAIREMIPIGETMYFVKERGVYAMQLADQIDPNRTNVAVPDTQQRVLGIGSDDPLVARTLLTAKTLINPSYLGTAFPYQNGLQVVLSILEDLVALTEIRCQLEGAEVEAKRNFESAERKLDGAFALPEIGNLKARCDAFAQKAGHIVNGLEELSKLFYPRELTKKWIDSLATVATERYGEDSPFAVYMRDARAFLLFVNDMRNMIEHPKPGKHIRINNFKLTPTAQIEFPFLEIIRTNEQPQKATITLLMAEVIENLLAVTEILIAHLCDVNAYSVGGLAISVVELLPEQRAFKHQRFYYGTRIGDQIVRCG